MIAPSIFVPERSDPLGDLLLRVHIVDRSPAMEPIFVDMLRVSQIHHMVSFTDGGYFGLFPLPPMFQSFYNFCERDMKELDLVQRQAEFTICSALCFVGN